MVGNPSWGGSSCSISYFRSGIFSNEPPHALNGGGRQCATTVSASTVSIDTALPDDLLEKIFSFLPVASVFKAASVCTRWQRVTRSMKCLSADRTSQRPWYFMFTFNDSPAGYAYDPNLRKWYNFDLPCIERSNWFVSSSRGLVCFMDNDVSIDMFVCNPITRDSKKVKAPPGVSFPDYSVLAMSVDSCAQSYTIAVAKTKLLSDDFLHSEFSVHVYESASGFWKTPVKEVLMGWRGGDEGVIGDDGVLYCLIHKTGVLGNAEFRHGLLAYDLFDRRPRSSPMCETIPIPFRITCGRLMIVRSRLVMVGGIAKHDRSDIIKGIGIWELQHKGRGEWREVARMPHRFFQGFGEFDDVFASSGAGDLVFIQSYGGPALLAFDMNTKLWRWSAKCPVSKRFPLQLFTGFCFEPSFEISS